MERRGAPRTTAALVGLLFALACVAVGASPASGGPEGGSYIVVLHDSVPSSAAVADEHRRAHGARLRHTYSAALKGYAAELTAEGYERVLRDPRVAYVEVDGTSRVATTQSGATWGIDRIDQRVLPLSTTYTYPSTGTGVTAYVIDSGIDIAHPDFGGRAVNGRDFIEGDLVAQDCHGHGTHVAGTVGSTTYGVAKSVRLVALRVLDCTGSGPDSGVIAAIDWVTANAVGASVVNLSLVADTDGRAMNNAIKNSIATGITYVVAAGNGGLFGGYDACNVYPANLPEAITVSATDSSDRRSSMANYGNCIDWFAPGVNIVSAKPGGGSATKSGTSMAAPHATGAVAMYLEDHRGATPQQVRDALYSLTTKDVVSSASSTNDHLLYVPSTWPSGDPSPSPTATSTATASPSPTKTKGGGGGGGGGGPKPRSR